MKKLLGLLKKNIKGLISLEQTKNKIKDLGNKNKDFEDKIKDLEQEIIYFKEKNSFSKKIMRNLDLREIPAIYINLEKHVEKNKSMQKILKECGFKKIIRVEGVANPENTVAGCSSAHVKGLSIIDPPFILFEDDCKINKFKPEIDIPIDSDAVYLGISSWGRMNGHSGPYVQYEHLFNDLYRIYNMLSGHSILYLSDDYVGMCKRICEHAGYVIKDYQDIGFAEIQRWFNIYAFDNPFFYQTSSYRGTVNPLTSYPTQECLNFNERYFLPKRCRRI